MGSPLRWEDVAGADSRATLVAMNTAPTPSIAPQILGYVARGIVVLLAIVGAYSMWSGMRVAPSLALEPASTGRLTLESATAERNQGFVTVTGDVVSRSGESLRDVVAVVELHDKNDHTVRLESAVVGAGTLSADQPVGFRVEMPDDSRAVSYAVRFRRLSGDRID